MEKLLQENHVKYGLIMTAITAVWVLLMHVTGVYTQPENDSAIDLLFVVVSPFVVWYLGIKAKKALQKGKLTYTEGVKEGFKIGVVYGLTSPFIFALYYLTINPDILNYIRESYDLLQAPVGLVIFVDMLAQFFASIVGGALYGAILSYFMTRKPAKAKTK